MIFFIVANAVYGSGEEDIAAGLEAMRSGMPMKISDFTGNMQTLLERGEVDICVQHDGEVFAQMDRGRPGRLALLGGAQADPDPDQDGQPWLERGPEAAGLRLHQPRLQPRVPGGLRQGGLPAADRTRTRSSPRTWPARASINEASAMEGLWNPDWDWYLDNEEDIVESVNEIFGQA